MTAAKRVVSLKGNESWSVSKSQSITDKVDPEKDAPFTVSVCRHFSGDMPGEGEGNAVARCPNPNHGFIKGDAHGRQFETKGEADKFLRKRGYTSEYYSQKEPLGISINPEETIREEARKCASRMIAQYQKGEVEPSFEPRQEDWHKYIRLVRLREDCSEYQEMFREEFICQVQDFFG